MNAAPPFRFNRVSRDVLRLLADHDDGRMFGARIAETLPRRWGLLVPYGAVAVALMRLERHGLVCSDWEPYPPPGKPRLRFYRLSDTHRDAVAAWLGTKG